MKVHPRWRKLWIAALPMTYLAVLQLILPDFWRSGLRFGQDGSSMLSRGAAVALVLAVGSAVIAGLMFLTRNAGKNEVYGTSATDAATPIAEAGGQPLPTRLVSDSELASMATTAFHPPAGLRPWHGHVLLREVIDHRTTDAFVAGLIADDALRITDAQPGSGPMLTYGPNIAKCAPIEQEWARRLLGDDDVVPLHNFDRDYTIGIAELSEALKEAIKESGWWRENGRPAVVKGAGSSEKETKRMLAGIPLVLLLIGAPLFSAGLASPVRLGLATAVLTFVAALVVIIPGLAARTAEGSAYALQVESFRRFLEGSESAHVERAWNQSQIREFGAWAIAIDRAEAWRPVVEKAGLVGFDDAFRLMLDADWRRLHER